MSIGFGIFCIALVIFYGITKDRLPWAQMCKWAAIIVGGILSVLIVVGLIGAVASFIDVYIISPRSQAESRQIDSQKKELVSCSARKKVCGENQHPLCWNSNTHQDPLCVCDTGFHKTANGCEKDVVLEPLTKSNKPKSKDKTSLTSHDEYTRCCSCLSQKSNYGQRCISSKEECIEALDNGAEQSVMIDCAIDQCSGSCSKVRCDYNKCIGKPK